MLWYYVQPVWFAKGDGGAATTLEIAKGGDSHRRMRTFPSVGSSYAGVPCRPSVASFSEDNEGDRGKESCCLYLGLLSRRCKIGRFEKYRRNLSSSCLHRKRQSWSHFTTLLRNKSCSVMTIGKFIFSSEASHRSFPTFFFNTNSVQNMHAGL